jgi:ParB family chromosome partitioning protein
MNKNAKRALGKGLSALLPEYQGEEPPEQTTIPISKVNPNSLQPRKHFDHEKLEELADSIKMHGIIQPIIARKVINGYEIIAGERRWRAAKLAGIDNIPAIIKDFSDKEALEIGLIENLQREDLNPVEEAQAYKLLMEEHQLTQDELSKRLGKSRAHVANTVRLLNLSEKVLAMLKDNRVSPGQIRPLLILEREMQETIADKIIKEGWNSRRVEEFVKTNTGKKTINSQKKGLSIPLKEIEENLREFLGTQVRIKDNNHKGKIEIEYYNQSDLNRIIEILTQHTGQI